MAIHRNPTRTGRLSPCASSTAFLADVLAGLARPRKELPCKYFYDQTGSRLFDDICQTPEYYPTRTELAIMRDHAAEMGARLGAGCQVIEYGSGSGVKTRVLLRNLPRPVAYAPVDISAVHMERSAAELARRFPEIEVSPIAADFTASFEVPNPSACVRRRVVYFPGSTIGNFATADAVRLLRRIARLCAPDGALLIGVDLKKDTAVLDAAYNDAAGITAAFNLNLLARINRELGADFNLTAFKHRAFFNTQLGRVEMHLVSQKDQAVRIGTATIPFAHGETIHTENSYKYTVREFHDLAAQARLRPVQTWTDRQEYFSVQLFTATG